MAAYLLQSMTPSTDRSPDRTWWQWALSSTEIKRTLCVVDTIVRSMSKCDQSSQTTCLIRNLRTHPIRWWPDLKQSITLDYSRTKNPQRWHSKKQTPRRKLKLSMTIKWKKKKYLRKRSKLCHMRNPSQQLKIPWHNPKSITKNSISFTREPASDWWQSSLSFSSNPSKSNGLNRRRDQLWQTSCRHSQLNILSPSSLNSRLLIKQTSWTTSLE